MIETMRRKGREKKNNNNIDTVYVTEMANNELVWSPSITH